MDRKDALKAEEVFERYRAGKSSMERRVIENEQWWKMRHWGEMKEGNQEERPVSAWLFNCLQNKHADAMDNYPRPVVLPREHGDVREADMLSYILPLILEENGFEQTYDRCWWQKLKSGTGCYGVFWNPGKENGLGDVDIRRIDLLNLFWEPGISDIQQSENVFHVELWNNDRLKDAFPILAGKTLGGDTLNLSRYLYDEQVDTSEKTPVIDWYYKKQVNGRNTVQFAKLACGEVLYASEDDPYYKSRGFYDHGLYPFVMDALFPTEGSPAGFGYVDVMKSVQAYIDRLNAVVMKNAIMSSQKRFLVRQDGSVNEKEFADWQKDIVHVSGTLDETNIREIQVSPLDGFITTALQNKVNELKETSGNREFSQGGTSGGVTAASAIAALQEAGNKLTRDMIKSAYRAFEQVCRLTVELVRQFYEEPRYFRILGEKEGAQFVAYDNSHLRGQSVGQEFFRAPVFDLKIRSEKSNPFSRLSQNEMAKEFYSLGFFDPNRASEALACLDMMDFEGKEEMKMRIGQGMKATMQRRQMEEFRQSNAMKAVLNNAMPESAAAKGIGR